MSKRIVVLGAGVAGAKALKSIHKEFHSDKHVTITVIDKQNYSAYTPMLHEVATGSVQADDITHPIRQIVSCCLERFVKASVQSIDLEQKIIKTDSGLVNYDYLVVALGSTNQFFGVAGADEFALTLKTMDDAIKLKRHIIDSFEAATKLAVDDIHRKHKLHTVIVGGGYTGVETAGQLADLFNDEFKELYPEIQADEPKVTLVQGGKLILPILSESSSIKAQKRLEELGVEVLTGSRVNAVTKEGVSLDNGSILESHNVIWASGVLARGAEFFPEESLERGRVKTLSTLQMEKHPNVFVIGDIAAIMHGSGPHPQTGQVAVQQAEIVGENIKAYMTDQPLQPFLYKHKGDLVPIGDRWAIAEIGQVKLAGFIAWWMRRTVYLLGLSWSDRARVVFTWTLNLFVKRDTTRL
jgi:NADH:ubiquinone reductase (H+-translocating)